MIRYFLYAITAVLFLVSCSTSSKFARGTLIKSQSEPVEIEFEYIEELICFNAEINGIKGKFIFDNGFSISAVNADFAKRAEINYTGTLKITDANNKRAVAKEADARSIIIGGLEFVDTGIQSIDSKRFLPCEEIDGIIGASVIDKVNWEIDFENKRIRISSKPFKNEGFKTKISISSNNSSFLDLSFNGVTTINKIDFGKSGGIELNFEKVKSAFKGYQAEKRIGIMSLSATGLGDEEVIYKVHQPIQFSSDDKPHPLKTKVTLAKNLRYQGFIGINYFKNYLVTINSTKKEYILSPRSKPWKEEKDKTYGISIYPIGSKWKLIKKTAGDPVTKNINLMDEIVQIDSLRLDQDLDICTYKKYIKEKWENEEVITIFPKNSTQSYKIKFRDPVLLLIEENE